MNHFSCLYIYLILFRVIGAAVYPSNWGQERVDGMTGTFGKMDILANRLDGSAVQFDTVHSVYIAPVHSIYDLKEFQTENRQVHLNSIIIQVIVIQFNRIHC